MKLQFIATVVLCATVSQTTVEAADDQDWTPPTSLADLPIIAGLPDALKLEDGRTVTTDSQWSTRRDQLKAMIQYFEYGHLPPRPERVRVEDLTAASLPGGDSSSGDRTVERMTLVIGADKPLRMRIAVYRSATTKQVPVIVCEAHALGQRKEMPMILDRGYMFVEFAREDLDPDKPDVIGAAQLAYPDHDWATLAVWAWGAMRVVDYLESRSDVTLDKVGIVGHSRGGKMALLAGALDERFALVAANGSGCGGAGCFRVQGGKAETLELITQPNRFGYWFHPRLRDFAGQENRLPIDQHFLKALVAPRALICTDALNDRWANPAGNRATSQAADQVFRLLGARNKNALHFRSGGHDLLPADWKAILDFADWHLLGVAPTDPDRFFQFPRVTN